MPYYNGVRIPSGKEFGEAWDQMMANRLAKLHFRIRPYPLHPGGDPIDLTTAINNDMIYRIFKMSKVGKKICFGEVQALITSQCFDATGDLVTLGPCYLDPVVWAQENGYYIEFEEGELTIAESGEGVAA